MRKATVSLCIIAKNEERFLGQCLESLHGIVDEIIIADTGSTDGTAAIAKTYGAEVSSYCWNDNFADARNYTLRLAQCDWILLLDADEALEAEDRQKLIDYINTTKADGCHFMVINYIGAAAGGSHTLHNAFRLLRNNGRYRFEGAIHEQIRRIDGAEITPGTFDVQDIRIHHYGYLDDVVKEKKKRERNIPIIQKLLDDDPDDSFMRFNLGNEYMAEGNYLAALEQYNLAHARIDTTQAYAPHLIYRQAMCLYTLRRMDAALSALSEGLAIYPACTDLEFLRGTVLAERGRDTLAIDSFEKCIRMGEPPSTLRFMEDCATMRPLLSLGKLYTRLEDYDRAIDCNIRALNINNGDCRILYTLGELYNARYEDKEQVEESLWRCLTARDHAPNLVVAADILLHLRLPDLAKKNLDQAFALQGCEADKAYLRARLCFCVRNYKQACGLFSDILASGESGQVLPCIPAESATLFYTAAMLGAPDLLDDALKMVRRYCDEVTSAVYTQVSGIISGNDSGGEIKFGDNAFQAVFILLDRVLRAGEFILFEKLLNLYNHMDSKAVLIHLAGVYLENGYHKMAASQVMRSVKELDYLDDKGIDILLKSRGSP